jgi:superfamily II DNA or RNA helicase
MASVRVEDFRMIPITERFLSDTGGWQALKQARALHDMGRVLAANYEPPLLQGRIREGEQELRSGLKILSQSNVENLCTCRESRRNGMICAHALAIGLEIIKPRPVAAAPVAPVTPPAPAIPEPVPGSKFSLDEGEPVEICVILPPNFIGAWEKGGIMLVIEAVSGGRRVLLSALDPSRTYRGTARELELIERLRSLNNGSLPGMATLSREALLRLLPFLSQHPKITFGKGAAATVTSDPIRVPLRVVPQADGSLRLRAEIPADGRVLLAGEQPWLFQGATLSPLAPGLPVVYQELLNKEIVLPASHAAPFIERELPVLRAAFIVEMPEGFAPAAPIAGPPSEGPRFVLLLEGSLNHLTAKLDARYGDRTFRLEAPRFSSRAPGAPPTRRNGAAEAAALEQLQKAGFAGPDGQGELILKGEPRILAFFARNLPRLEKVWDVTIGARFGHVTRDIERIQPKLEIRSSGENWFDLQIELSSSGGERFSAAEIQRLLQSGQTSTRLKNRKIAVFDPGMLDEFEQALLDCDPQQRQPGLYRIAQSHASYLENVATEQGAQIRSDPQWQQWVEARQKIGDLPSVPLGDLETVLRPYQKQGVNWLKSLQMSGLAGVIADEMGLGKTLQALAFLRAIRGKNLIVCPSSLVFNWQREAARFTPELRTLAVQGSERRELFGQPMQEADLIITSYPLLRRDVERYRSMEFTTAILDEAQHIKNPDSLNAQAACALRAKHRFILTGTPLENSVRDLWSLMHFLMPGYLGTRVDFRERYEREIQNDPAGPSAKRLIKRIKPFILRRLKRDVIKELPDKIEQISYCELNEKQRDVYKELVNTTRRQVSEFAGSKDQNKARMVMLTALLRLRQACCDLRLLGLETAPNDEASGKVDLLMELLEEVIDGGHRVLIFSQFVTMLHLLEAEFKERSIPFCYLDGSTKDRGSEVDRFQNGDAPAFLISLKAGGVGLNLTAADTVIHFDPWWNPAVEAQATDRAHRIGQNKVVTAYKLITRGTVEEKILALQQRKRAMTEAALESEQPLMEGLSISEIEEMLA